MRSRLILAASPLLLLPVLLPACREADPTAPSDTALSISANPPAIPLGGKSKITVIANRGNGNPVVDGTVINMTTTLGTIPKEIFTNRGIATCDLQAGTIAGEAEVIALAGAADTAKTTVQFGSASTTLTLSANPASLPVGGGSSALTCVAFDENSSPISGIPIQFSTTAGTLASGGALVYTNSSGQAQDTLTTTEDATVSASSGSTESNSVTVTVEEEGIGDTVGSVTVSANPPVVSPNQPSYIVATVFSSTGNLLPGAPVVFSTTKGSLSSGGNATYTDSGGQAYDTLYTSETATVTAASGSKTGTATVTVQLGTLSLTSDRAQISSCTDVPNLTATLLDALGSAVPGATIGFSIVSGPGTISPGAATTNSSGQASTQLFVSQTDCNVCTTTVPCDTVIQAIYGTLSDTYTVTIAVP